MLVISVIFPQASYLVGVSDPNSQAGHQGLVDPIQFAKANQAIQMACQNLVDPESSPSQVYTHALPSIYTIQLPTNCQVIISKCNVQWQHSAIALWLCCSAEMCYCVIHYQINLLDGCVLNLKNNLICCTFVLFIFFLSLYCYLLPFCGTCLA